MIYRTDRPACQHKQVDVHAANAACRQLRAIAKAAWALFDTIAPPRDLEGHASTHQNVLERLVVGDDAVVHHHKISAGV